MEINYKKIAYKTCEVLYWALFALFMFFIFKHLLIDSTFKILIYGEGKLEGRSCRAILCSIISSSFVSLIFKNKIFALISLCIIPITFPFIHDFIKWVNS